MIVGLTGGIGSGKSTVARLFSILGCAVFSSDQTAKEVYYDPLIKIRIINLLGKKSYRSNGKINKGHISSRIFSDSALLHQLNGIIHPAVRIRMNEFINANSGKLIVKETALLYEASLEEEVDKVIVVAADDRTRISRVMKRDGIEESDVMLRVQAQMPQEDKIRKADFVIWNNDDSLVIPQVVKIFNELCSKETYPA